MKNHQNGFIAYVVLFVVAVSAVGGGYFFLESQKVKFPKLSQNTNLSESDLSIPEKPTTKTSAISQNISDVAEAQANLAKINAQYQQMGFESGKKLTIATPSTDNILEPGKPVTVVFSPIEGAVFYEISITKPAYIDKSSRITSGGKTDILLSEVTTETTHVIIVPESKDFETSENSYNGEVLVVKALDKNKNQLKITVTQQGKQYEVPAMDQKQIKILSLPTQPSLLDADRYVLEREGGTIVLKFGALQFPNVSRKLTFVCPSHIPGMLSIDGVACSRLEKVVLEFKSEAFTKNFIVKGNTSSKRDTAAALRVQYYDAKGNEINPQGLDDESWLSIKIKK